MVQRAAARCSSLFGERMSFRTLEESNALKAENGRDKVTEYQEEVSEAVNTRQLCPVAECGRSQRPFGRRDNLLRHLRIVHGLDKQEVAEESKADESMVGGVHNNGFLKQIPVRRGWRGRDVEQRARPTLEQLRRKRMDS